MQIPTEFKGRVYFHWNMKYGFISIADTEISDLSDYVFLGCSNELHVKFDANHNADAVIDKLEQAIEDEKAASLHRINLIRGQIQSLRALEHVA